MKSPVFNGLLMAATVILAFVPIRALPDRRAMPAVIVPLSYRAVPLPRATAPLRLAGAWEMAAPDPRLGGLSALAVDQGRLLAVSDRGAVARFELPTVEHPSVLLQDLRDGPGPAGKKWARDAESIVRDPNGRGWWVGYEQRHSLWLYDASFGRVLATIGLPKLGWRDNRGAEGLTVSDGRLLVLAENGRQAIRVGEKETQLLKLHAGAEVAEAARAPNGGIWVLLREKGPSGISQSIAPLLKAHDGYRLGRSWPIPKAASDNFEGMAVTTLPDGRWRFWLVTDDGHRIMARTLLIALDPDMPTGHSKSPATSAGLSRIPNGKKP